MLLTFYAAITANFLIYHFTSTVIVLIHILSDCIVLYCIVLYSDLEHFCGFYALQNKLLLNYYYYKGLLNDQ